LRGQPMNGETMLRVADVANEAAMESIRDILDQLDVAYEYVRSEPDEDRYPQTAYFYVPDDSAEVVEQALADLSSEHGFDAEVL
jgi:hypothetical protein